MLDRMMTHPTDTVGKTEEQLKDKFKKLYKDYSNAVYREGEYRNWDYSLSVYQATLDRAGQYLPSDFDKEVKIILSVLHSFCLRKKGDEETHIITHIGNFLKLRPDSIELPKLFVDKIKNATLEQREEILSICKNSSNRDEIKTLLAKLEEERKLEPPKLKKMVQEQKLKEKEQELKEIKQKIEEMQKALTQATNEYEEMKLHESLPLTEEKPTELAGCESLSPTHDNC